MPNLALTFRTALAALLLSVPFTARAGTPPASGDLLVPASADLASFKTEKDPVLSLAEAGGAPVIKIEFPGGGGYPGVNLPIPDGSWDLSAYSGIQVEIANVSDSRLNVGLRVDNPGDWKKSPWNSGNVWLAPGEAKLLKVVFGQSYGRPGYALDPSKVSGIKILADNPQKPAAILIKSVRATGTATATVTAGAASPAPIRPAATAAAAPTTASQLFTPDAATISSMETEKGTVLSLDTSSGAPALKAEFPGGSGYPGFNFPIPGGAFNLSAFAGIQVELTNVSQEKLNINLRADNPGDWKKSPWNTENTWIAPGETKTLKVTFGRSFGNPGYALDGSRVSALKLFAATPKQTSAILVKNLRPFGTGSAPAAAPAVAATAVPATPAAAPAAGAVVFNAATVADLTGFDTGEGTQVELAHAGGAQVLQVTFPAMSGYPSFDFAKPAGGTWNLSAFAGLQIEVVNSGANAVVFALRADNPGDWRKQPWNVEQTRVGPGETKILKLTFGRSYSNPGYALDSSRISGVKVFAVNPTKGATLQVKSLSGFGTASAAPVAAAPVAAGAADPAAAAGTDSTFSPPISGELLTLTGADPLARFNYSDASGTLENGKIKVVFAAGSNYPNIQFPVPAGGWNLAAFGGVEIAITNPGDRKVGAYLRVDNPGNWKNQPWNTHNLTVGPGETKTLKLTFGQENGAPGFPLNPARISGIQLFIVRPKQDTTLVLSDLKAWGSPADSANKLSFSKPEDRNVPAVLPAWLGQRPPVEGDWVQTLDENFDGTALNDKLWTPRFPWDGPQPGQLQRYAPENVTVENGIAVFKVEKKFGHENNDPKLGSRNYTSGLIQSYDKWSQLYGYFESRVKVPYVRGLWPAFWMMPDRGRTSGLSTWQRRDTAKGGMEIDIMEILSEWGPGRNSVATHWDGYGTDHKQWGTTQIYYGPTADGWHVFGLLWEPGKLTWYVDGVKKAEWANERVGSIPGYLKFNVQMGGWATKEVDEAGLPAVMQVDYARAWQLKSRK